MPSLLQSNEYASVSLPPVVSAAWTVMTAEPGAMIGPLLVTLRIPGATSPTTRAKVVVLTPPWPSLPVMVTVWLWAGSLAAKLHDRVPLPLLTTVPDEAVSATVSWLASLTVPVLAAVWPSLTATLALLEVRTGAMLGSMAIPHGSGLSGTVAVTVFVAVSMTDSELPLKFDT